LHKYSDKWTKIGVNLGICLGNSRDNFQLHQFTTSENIAKSFRGATFFDSHCIVQISLLVPSASYGRSCHGVRTDGCIDWCNLTPTIDFLSPARSHCLAIDVTSNTHQHRCCQRQVDRDNRHLRTSTFERSGQCRASIHLVRYPSTQPSTLRKTVK